MIGNSVHPPLEQRFMTSNTGRKAQKKPNLTREKILTEAIHLADEQSLDALSMRKLAKIMGVEAMSLYNHVKNKEDMLDGMIDIIIDQIYLPEIHGNWRDEMKARALSAHQTMMQHPWACLLVVSRINTGEAMLTYINATIGNLIEAGFTGEQADQAWNALDSHIYGFTLQKINFPFEPSEYASAAESFIHMIPEDKYAYMYQLSQMVIKKEYSGLQDFEFGLNLILDGLEKLLENPNGS